MAQDVTKVQVGAARVFIGITNPATGTPPTLMTHTAGVPGSGVEAGFTVGDCVFSYVATKTEIFGEQALGPVDVYTGDEQVKLVFTMQEHNYASLKIAFDNIGSVDDGSKTLFYGGGGTAILAPTKQGIMFTALQRLAPTKFLYGVIYKGYSIKGYSSPFAKKNPSVIQVEIHGLVDSSRNAGDTMFQFVVEK